MRRIISSNPHRTEENKDSFDYAMGMFVVETQFSWRIFRYSGNNMQESIEQRQEAEKEAKNYRETFEQVGINTSYEEIKY